MAVSNTSKLEPHVSDEAAFDATMTDGRDVSGHRAVGSLRGDGRFTSTYCGDGSRESPTHHRSGQAIFADGTVDMHGSGGQFPADVLSDVDMRRSPIQVADPGSGGLAARPTALVRPP